MRALWGRLSRVARFGTSTAANFAEAGAQEATSSSAAQSAQLQALHKPYSEGGWFKRHSGVPIAFLSGSALGLAGGVYGGKYSTGQLVPSTVTELFRGFQPWWADKGSAAATPVPIAPASPSLGLSPNFIADAAAKAAPAVVSITVQPTGRTLAEAGSGFVVKADGTIITSLHIVQHALSKRSPPGKPLRNAKPVNVALPDGRRFEGRITAIDRPSGLAVVKVDPREAPLPAVELGTAQHLRVGEWVMALGSPFALHNTVTAGIVSCPHRKAEELGLPHSACAYIQTDLAVNSGNSGGPLVDLQGHVIGVANLTTVAASSLSFAVPVDAVHALLRQAERGARPHVGLKLLQLTPSTAARFREGDSSFPPVEEGLLVPAVTPGSPAARADLRAGDVIVGCSGVQHLTTEGLVGCFADSIGSPVTLEVKRGPSQRLRLRVTPLPAE